MTSRRGRDASQHPLIHLIKDALRRASRSLHMRLAEHSVSVGHWTFLRILWLTDGLIQSELSERAGLMQPTTFFAVNGMEQFGYIRREAAEQPPQRAYLPYAGRTRAAQEARALRG